MGGIFSLDVSAASTGWCYTNNGFEFVSGKIQTQSSSSRSERLFAFSQELTRLLLCYKPENVVQEDTFSGKNIKTLKILSEFAGIAKFTCYSILKIDPYIIDNNTVKAYFKARTKEDLFIFMCVLFDVENLNFKKYNDEVDAKAQLLCYADIVLQKYKYRFDKDYGYLYLEDFQ